MTCDQISLCKLVLCKPRDRLVPRMCVAQYTISSVVVAKEKIVQRTMLERRTEHSKHALPSTEDRATPPLKYQNISTSITQATTSSLQIHRYWIETPTGLPGESGKPSTPSTLNRDGGRYNLPAIWNRLIWLQAYVTCQITSTVMKAPARGESSEQNFFLCSV